MDMRLKLIIAEPWDFKSTDGDNILFGMANSQDRGIGKYGDWLIVTCTPFIENQISLTSLVLSARHDKKFIDNLIMGKDIAVNAYWHKEGLPWNANLVAQFEQGSKIMGGFLIADVMKMK